LPRLRRQVSEHEPLAGLARPRAAHRGPARAPCARSGRTPGAGAVSLTDEQIELYSRQILLRELGGVGQRRLLAASVLALGDGVAADAALSYLAGAGVGRIDRLASASRSRPDPD